MNLSNLPAIGTTVYTVERDEVRERKVYAIETGNGRPYNPATDGSDCHLQLKPKSQCFCYFDPCQVFESKAEAKRYLAAIYRARAASLLAEATSLDREAATEAAA